MTSVVMFAKESTVATSLSKRVEGTFAELKRDFLPDTRVPASRDRDKM